MGDGEEEPAVLPSESLSQDDGEPQSKVCPIKEPCLGQKCCGPGYPCSVIDLEQPMASLCMNAAQDPKEAAARGFLLLELLTAGSLLKGELREYLHGRHRPCHAACTSTALIQDTQGPEQTPPYMAVIFLSYGNSREEIVSELTRYQGREALDMSSSYFSVDPHSTIGCEASWSQ